MKTDSNFLADRSKFSLCFPAASKVYFTEYQDTFLRQSEGGNDTLYRGLHGIYINLTSQRKMDTFMVSIFRFVNCGRIRTRTGATVERKSGGFSSRERSKPAERAGAGRQMRAKRADAKSHLLRQSELKQKDLNPSGLSSFACAIFVILLMQIIYIRRSEVNNEKKEVCYWIGNC